MHLLYSVYHLGGGTASPLKAPQNFETPSSRKQSACRPRNPPPPSIILAHPRDSGCFNGTVTPDSKDSIDIYERVSVHYRETTPPSSQTSSFTWKRHRNNVIWDTLDWADFVVLLQDQAHRAVQKSVWTSTSSNQDPVVLSTVGNRHLYGVH